MDETLPPIIPPREELFPPTVAAPVGDTLPQPVKPAGTMGSSIAQPQVIITRKVVKQSDTMRGEDWKKWAKNFLMFSLLPAGIVFINVLQTTLALHQGGWDTSPNAMAELTGAVKVALMAAGIDLITKYKAGI